MIKGAIFDLDGTILDSMFIWDTIGEDYLRSIGYEPKEKLNETFKNLSLRQAACYYKSEYGVTLTVDEIVDGVNKMIEKYYTCEVKLKSGVKELLEKFEDNRVKMCIATATDIHLVKAALKRLDIDGYFSEIFTCSSVGYGKDEPVIYRKALEFLGTDKSKTIVFEDAAYAVKTAKKDGFVTAAVSDIYEKNQKEIKNLADFYITDYRNIEDICKFVSAI